MGRPAYEVGQRNYALLLPHVWFQALHDHTQEMFKTAASGQDDAAAKIWRTMSTNPFVQEHPCLRERDLPRTIPLGLHGDAGSFSHQDSVYIFAWNSLLGEGTTTATRFVIGVFKKSDVTEETFRALFDVVSWSFNVLLSGVEPAVDWRGNPMAHETRYLAGRYRGCLCQIRGDWQFFCELFKFPQWNCALSMCWLCDASGNIPGLNFRDFTSAAGWRRTRRTHAIYVASMARSGRELPTLLAKVVGLRLECIMIDILHCVDQGVASHVIGNILWELVLGKKFVGGRSNQEKEVAGLMVRLKEYYKANKGVSKIQGRLTSERIRTSKGWPKLKAKAAATRQATRFALELASEFDSGSSHDRRRRAVCQLLVRFYDILDAEGMYLSAEAKEELPRIGLSFGVIYGQLSAEAEAMGQRLWKATPKFHLFQHLLEWQSPWWGLNPKTAWTYADEDLVGHMVEVASTCHPKTMSTTALFKWLCFAFDA